MSLSRYNQDAQVKDTLCANEQDALKWLHGLELPPLRNFNANYVTQAQLEQLEFDYDYHRNVFKMWVPEDAAKYTEINELTVNGLCIIKYCSRHFVPEQLNEVIILEWLSVFSRVPSHAQIHTPPTDPGHQPAARVT